MCLNPPKLDSGHLIACNRCWQCAGRVVDDWVGRCLAEARTSSAVHSVTLTYGHDLRYDGGADHVRAAVLTYSDFQHFVRKLRDVRTKEAPRGYRCRYFVVGEYGTLKGRTHWHAILFWRDVVPPGIVLRKEMVRFDPYWEHGFVWWDNVHLKSVRYVAKYLMKRLSGSSGDAGDDAGQFHMQMSKRPPLGAAYFREMAHDHVRQGLAPQTFGYVMDEARYQKGKRAGRPRQMLLQGASRDLYLAEYLAEWNRARPGEHVPNSEIVEEYIDRTWVEDRDRVRKLLEGEKVGLYRLTDTVPEKPFRGTVKKPGADDLRRWMAPERIVWREKLNCWLYQFEGDQSPWYWARDPDTGVWGWREKIGRGFQPAPAPDYRTETGRSGRVQSL